MCLKNTQLTNTEQYVDQMDGSMKQWRKDCHGRCEVLGSVNVSLKSDNKAFERIRGWHFLILVEILVPDKLESK